MCSYKSNTKSDASQGTCNILKKNTKASLDLIREAVSAYLKDQEKFINNLTEQHLVDKEHIKKMIIHGSSHASLCCPSLANTIVHFKSKKINESKFLFLSSCHLLLHFAIVRLYCWALYEA